MSQFKELLQADFEVAAQNAFKKSSLSLDHKAEVAIIDECTIHVSIFYCNFFSFLTSFYYLKEK